MPDEIIVGGLLRFIGSILMEVASFLLEFVVMRVGRVAIYLLTLGRIDTDCSAEDSMNWVAGVAGFLVMG